MSHRARPLRPSRPSRLLPLAVLVAVVALAAAAMLAPRGVEAHAAFVSSDPAPNAVLDAAPSEVTVRFSERLVPAGSEMQVLDASGERVDEGGTAFSADDDATMSVGLRDGLADGVYTVAWRNLSDIDGHPLTGSFAFFVGEGEFEAVAPVQDVPLLASPAEPVVRWAVLLGGFLLAGGPLAFAMTLRPALRDRDDVRRIRTRIDGVAVAGGIVMLAGSVAHLLVQSQSSGLGVGSVLADTTWGRAWLIRVALASVAVALFALLRRGRPAWARHAAGRPAAMLAAAAAIAAVSLSSHAAATRGVEVVATLVDATHILAAAVWGGGLVAFLVLLLGVRRRREARSVLRVAVPRFSVLGIVATAALAVTGTYSAWLQVVTWRALDTPYGVGVLVKVAALVLLLALAAVNLVWVRRRLEHADSGAPATRWLGRIMRAEVAGIIVAVVAAGTIASLEPARQSVVRQEAEAGQRSTGEDADLSITLAVSPGGVGSNELTALLERGGDAYDGATGVMATLSYLDRELGTQEVPLARDAGEEGAWAASLVLSVAGEYQVSVLVQRDDGFDARHAFRFQAGGTGAGGAVVEASPRRAWWLGVGALAVVGLVVTGAGIVGSRRGVLRGSALAWGGAGIAAVAFLLVGRVPDASDRLANPIVPVPASIETGLAVYQANCLTCHGETGRGDGPQAPLLQFPPANLVLHVPLHTDGELFETVRDGVPRLGMPAMGDSLTDEEMWHLVNYLRVLVDEQAATRATE